MLQRAMRACGQRFGLQTLLLGYLLLLCFATPGFALPAGAGKAAAQASASSTQVELEGELEVLHEDDFKNKKSRTRHFLKTEAGERYELKFSQRPVHYQSGSKVRVRGSKSGNEITLEAGGTATNTGDLQLLAAAAPNTFGEQRTLVLLVNFQDQPATKPWTTEQVRSLVFGTVSDYFKENSYQNTWLNGDVYGWYTIPVSSTVCDQTGIATYAKQVATAAGVNLSAYTRYVYLFPNNTPCGWSGTATVGGTPSQAWINGRLDLPTIGHEMGHNIGLEHSHSWSCNDGSIIGTGAACSAVEYGDGADIMGWSSSGHLHAFQKERLGWLNNGAMPPITTVTTSGTYTIAPYESGSSAPKALKILKSTDSYGFKTWYYVEYRQATGFDNPGGSGNSMMNASNILSGVLVHRGYEGNGGNTNDLLDMTPSTYDFYTRDPALPIGQSFTDSAAGITISTQWVNGSSAGISVTLDGSSSSCTRAKPSVLLSPSQSASVAAGTPVAYTVAVTNNDSTACAASSFSLQSAIPAGWSASFAAPTLSIGPGGAASTSLMVASPVTALAGTYNVGITVTSSAGATYSGIGSATYSVGAGSTATFTTVVSADKVSYASGDTVKLTSSVTSGGKPLANVSVTFAVTKPNGSVVSQMVTTGSTGQAIYKLRLSRQKDPSGVYQAKATASSNGSLANATTNFSVQ